MRAKRIGIGFLAAAVLATGTAGCSTMNNTEKGTLAGGALGAGVGTLIGAATHNPKTGAVVGGLVGAGTGAIVGNNMDQKEAKEIRQTNAAVANAAAAQAQQQRMGLIDVVTMVEQGQSEPVIINQIRNTGSTFPGLTPSDLAFLKSRGVPDGVIVAMQNARPVAVVGPPPQRVIVQDSPTVIVREPAPVIYYGRPRGYYYYR